ncbi:hypothetical protein P8452_54783 [Trifolium repens]|nr:hypothetical protein P8452_54783 [Trifolium repens]
MITTIRKTPNHQQIRVTHTAICKQLSPKNPKFQLLFLCKSFSKYLSTLLNFSLPGEKEKETMLLSL